MKDAPNNYSSDEDLLPGMSQPKKRRIQILESSSDKSSSCHSSFEDGTASSCESEEQLTEDEIAKRWRSDLPLVRQLSMLDIAICAFEIDDFATAPVPPAKDAVGEYDVVFVRWEAQEDDPICHGFCSRTAHGSLLLVCDTEDRDNSYSHLRGEIRLNGHSDDHSDKLALPPYATRTLFSFDLAGEVDVRTSAVCASPDGEAFAGVNTLPPDNNEQLTAATSEGLLRLEREDLEACDVWNCGNNVTLQWFGERVSLDWIPEDTCVRNDPYARCLREKLQRRRSSPPDWPKSWLHRRASLPAAIVGKIHDYIAFLPETEFWINSNDLLVSIKMEAHLGDSLDMCVVARKRNHRDGKSDDS